MRVHRLLENNNSFTCFLVRASYPPLHTSAPPVMCNCMWSMFLFRFCSNSVEKKVASWKQFKFLTGNFMYCRALILRFQNLKIDPFSYAMYVYYTEKLNFFESLVPLRESAAAKVTSHFCEFSSFCSNLSNSANASAASSTSSCV